MRRLHFAGASLFALAVATPLFAQAPAQPAPQAAEAEDTSADIIVTASKRAQTLQDTPISVAVASAQQIEQSQIRDLIDLQTLVPSLRVGQLQSSANTNFIIRGFGNGANNIGIEPSVGVFIDGVYRSRSAAQIGDLPNIERVEVLRGPQSTLFGKNASAGIISIVTAEPQFKFGGQLEASYGNYNAIVVKGSVTGPLSETIAVSLAGNYNKRDGYAQYANLNLDTNDRNRYGVRGQILFQPSSDFKVRIIADYDRIDEVCCTVANIFDGPTGNAVRGLGGKITSNQPFSYIGYANFPSSNKIDNYGVSAQMDWQFNDNLALTSISSYRAVKTDTDADSDFTSADIIGKNANQAKIDTFTQDLRLQTSFDGPLNSPISTIHDGCTSIPACQPALSAHKDRGASKNMIIVTRQYRCSGRSILKSRVASRQQLGSTTRWTARTRSRTTLPPMSSPASTSMPRLPHCVMAALPRPSPASSVCRQAASRRRRRSPDLQRHSRGHSPRSRPV